MGRDWSAGNRKEDDRKGVSSAEEDAPIFINGQGLDRAQGC